MAVTKITWENKTGIQNDASVARKNKVVDEDMNEIKQVVNNNADEVSEIQENIEDLQGGQGSTKISKINENFLNLNNLQVANNNGIDTYSIDNANQITLKNKTLISGTPYSYSFQAFELNLPAGNYNLSAKTETNSSNYRIIIRGKKDGSNTTATEVVSQSKNNGNFNIDYSQCDEYTIEFYANQAYVEQLVTTTYYDIQIQKGNIATDYVEHKQTDYLLYIQQEMLEGDYFVKEADGWKEVHNWDKYIFTGNESFLEASSPAEGTKRFYYENNNLNMYIYNSLYPTQNNFCNYFKALSWGAIYSSDTTTKNAFICYNNGTAKRMHFRIDSNIASSVNEFKQLLTEKYNAGNPVYAFYKSATPTKLACTEQQSAVLEQLSNLDLFEGVNNIITSEDIALLKLKYVVDTKTYIDNLLASQVTAEEA